MQKGFSFTFQPDRRCTSGLCRPSPSCYTSHQTRCSSTSQCLCTRARARTDVGGACVREGECAREGEKVERDWWQMVELVRPCIFYFGQGCLRVPHFEHMWYFHMVYRAIKLVIKKRGKKKEKYFLLTTFRARLAAPLITVVTGPSGHWRRHWRRWHWARPARRHWRWRRSGLATDSIRECLTADLRREEREGGWREG